MVGVDDGVAVDVLVAVDVNVAVGDGVIVGVDDGVKDGVIVNVDVLVGVGVNVTTGRSTGPLWPRPSRSRRIQPPSYCLRSGSLCSGAIRSQVSSSLSARNVRQESRSSGSPNTAKFVPGPERTLILRTSISTLMQNLSIGKVCLVTDAVGDGLVGVMVFV